MKTARLYKRVSTKEQEEYGFSLPDQDRRLSEYCVKNQIKILGVYQDDCSGKNFDRPGFQDLLKENKGHPAEYILFTKWSRFSRNTADSYQMINTLGDHGTLVQAIDEPIDLSVPQNYLLLAFHLTMPDVDNKIRSKSTKDGMVESLLQGRYCSSAPIGYINMRDEGDKPIIVPDAERSYFIYKAFDLMATGGYSQNEVREVLNKEGAKITKTRLSVILQNPIYSGQVHVPAHNGQQAKYVKGIHEPLVDEETFAMVQDVLKGKNRIKGRKRKVQDEYLLKGFLYCSNDHKMTGSCSHGRNDKYHYYHCWNHLHCTRLPTEFVNEAAKTLLMELEVIETNKRDLKLIYDVVGTDLAKINNLQREIEKCESRMKVLQVNLMDQHISGPEFREMKEELQAELFRLRTELSRTTTTDAEFTDETGDAITVLSNIGEFFNQSSVDGKRALISYLCNGITESGSILPPKLWMEKNKCRTAFWNPAVSLLCNTGGASMGIKTLGQSVITRNVPYGDPDGTIIRTNFQNSTNLRLGIKQLAHLNKLLRA